MGYGFADGDWADYPTLELSGMYRVSKKFLLLTENYLITVGGGYNFGILSFGGRYGGQRIAIDYGVFRPIGEDFGVGFWALPWVGLNVPFGRRKIKVIVLDADLLQRFLLISRTKRNRDEKISPNHIRIWM